MMNESDKDLVYSENVKAGKRIYYFDVKQSKNGDKFIAITESKKINEGTMENPRFVFEKHKLFLYKEDYDKFVGALLRTLDAAKEGVAMESRQEVEERYVPVAEDSAPGLDSGDFKIDIDF